MSDEPRTFLDTNVLVYAVSDNEPEKQLRAQEIVARGFAEGRYVVSTQVLLELYVTITRKATVSMSLENAFRYVRAFQEWPVMGTDSSLVVAAIQLAQSHRISVWDAAILEAARRMECTRVLSEDLSDGHSYAGIRVENPF